MKILFVPFSILSGFLAGMVATKLFDAAWRLISDEEAPEPGHRDISLPQLVAALAIEGAIFRVSRGLVDRGSRMGFFRLTGSWPGEEEPDQS